VLSARSRVELCFSAVIAYKSHISLPAMLPGTWLYKAPIVWRTPQQESGVLLPARQDRNDKCREQEVQSPGLHDAAVLWKPRQQEGGVLYPARAAGHGPSS
ncbi:unnamed protein product, partial [Ectocarpus fasciculatus]